MKKRTYILIEVMIAIALLALCAIPLVSSSREEYIKYNASLFNLELERQAEVFFYDALLASKDITWEQHTTQTKKDPKYPEKKTISIEGLGSKELNYHCHIYYSGNNLHPKLRMHFYDICLDEDKPHENQYKFSVFAKKVEENSQDPHGEKYHEGLSTNVQTLRQSEGNTD